MKLVTGKVENGKVAVPASTPDDPVTLTSAEEQALVESLSDIRSGSYTAGEDVLRHLRFRGR
jgi:hypothetical protein